MDKTFSPITLQDKHEYLSHWQATPQHSIDYALANIWGWAQYFNLEWRSEGPLCWLRQGLSCLWAPVGNWHVVDWEAETTLRKGTTLQRVPEELALLLAERLPGRVHSVEARGHWEYLYNRDELATLPGNRFHKKRNHVNAFRKTYGKADYRSVNTTLTEDVLALQDEWCKWHECANSPALQAENEAINRVLSHWEELPGLMGGALYVDNKVVAFSVGEALDGTTLGVHYEKGRDGFRGVYQSMNALFATKAGEGFALLNRAQDLDEEGLRQAKMTYLPTDFLRKYTVTIDPA